MKIFDVTKISTGKSACILIMTQIILAIPPSIQLIIIEIYHLLFKIWHTGNDQILIKESKKVSDYFFSYISWRVNFQ
jgi:hypothetical protein